MDETIGNQQVTSHQLAWMAGIWDGEGSFVISYYSDRQSFAAAVQLTNSSPEMINEVVKIINIHGITGHLYLEPLRTKKHKRCYHLKISRFENMIKITKLMFPYLIAKKAQAEIFIRFVESRMKHKKQVNQDPVTGRLLGVKRTGYTDEEKSLIEQLKLLNKTGIKEDTSETTR
jgi:hypothetical protein